MALNLVALINGEQFALWYSHTIKTWIFIFTGLALPITHCNEIIWFDFFCCCKHLLCFGILTHFCWEPGESQSLEGRIVLMWCQHRSETKKLVIRFKDKLQSLMFSNLYMKSSQKVDIPIQTFLPLLHFHCATIWSGFQSFQVCPTF